MSDIGHTWTNEPYFSLGAPASPPAGGIPKPAGTPALPGKICVCPDVAYVRHLEWRPKKQSPEGATVRTGGGR